MPYEQLKRASQELVLHYLDGFRATQPTDSQCPNWEDIVLNERWQVVLCCMVDKNDGPGILGNLFEMSYEDIRKAKSRHKVCDRCFSSGCAYLVCNPFGIAPKVHPSADVISVSAEELAHIVFVERPPSCAGYFETASRLAGDRLLVEGWARDPVKDCPAPEIILLDEKRGIIACGPVNIERDDAVRAANLDLNRMRNCGWRIAIQSKPSSSQPQHIIGYAFNRAEKVAYRLVNIMRVRAR